VDISECKRLKKLKTIRLQRARKFGRIILAVKTEGLKERGNWESARLSREEKRGVRGTSHLLP